MQPISEDKRILYIKYLIKYSCFKIKNYNSVNVGPIIKFWYHKTVRCVCNILVK